MIWRGSKWCGTKFTFFKVWQKVLKGPWKIWHEKRISNLTLVFQQVLYVTNNGCIFEDQVGFFITMTVEIFLPILNYNVESWSGTLKRGTRAAQEESLSGLKNPGHDLCLMSAFFRALCTKRIANTVIRNETKKSHYRMKRLN